MLPLNKLKDLLAKQDVQLINLLSSKMLIAAGKQPEETNDPPPISTVVTTESPVSQPSATLPINAVEFLW